MLADAQGVGTRPETTDPFLQEEARVSGAGRGSLPAKTQGPHLLGCHNKAPQPGWLERGWRQKAQGQDAGRRASREEPASCLPTDLTGWAQSKLSCLLLQRP